MDAQKWRTPELGRRPGFGNSAEESTCRNHSTTPMQGEGGGL